MDEYPNIAFDLTPGFEMYEYFGRKPGRMRRDFFIRYGSRILFGTEGGLTGPPFGWPDALMRGKVDFMKRFLETAEEAVFSYEPRFTFRTVGLNLPPETLKKIYRQNFLARLSSQKPRPLNREPAIAECRRTIEYLRRAGAQTPDRGARRRRWRRSLSFCRGGTAIVATHQLNRVAVFDENTGHFLDRRAICGKIEVVVAFPCGSRSPRKPRIGV